MSKTCHVIQISQATKKLSLRGRSHMTSPWNKTYLESNIA